MDEEEFLKKLGEVCEYMMVPHLHMPDKKRSDRPYISKTARKLVEQGEVPCVPIVVSYPQQNCPYGKMATNGKPKQCKKTVAYTKVARSVYPDGRYRVEYCGACKTIFLPNGKTKHWPNAAFTYSRSVYDLIKEANKEVELANKDK